MGFNFSALQGDLLPKAFRVEFFIKSGTDYIALPIEYRTRLLSLVKRAICTHCGERFEYLFGKDRTVVKPYVFAIQPISSIKAVTGSELIQRGFTRSDLDDKEKYLLLKNGFKIIWQSFDIELTSAIYNHFMELRISELALLSDSERESTKTHVRAFVNRTRPINSYGCWFKAISPVLIRDSSKQNRYWLPPELQSHMPADIKDKPVNEYVDLFNENLRRCLEPVVRTVAPALTPLVRYVAYQPHPANLVKRVIVRHMSSKNPKLVDGMKFSGFVGEFFLNGPPEILSIVAGIGLGSRRSQGYGLVVPLSG